MGESRMPGPLLKVAVLGPESSGKTTLALALTEQLTAQGMRVCYVAEYARAYYQRRPYQPQLHDILAIAIGQWATEVSAAGENEVLICDSTATTCKIWSEVAFNQVSRGLEALHRVSHYDLTLLAKPDIPWEKDRLRSHPLERDWLFTLYQKALWEQGIEWVEVAGSHTERLAVASSAIVGLIRRTRYA